VLGCQDCVGTLWLMPGTRVTVVQVHWIYLTEGIDVPIFVGLEGGWLLLLCGGVYVLVALGRSPVGAAGWICCTWPGRVVVYWLPVLLFPLLCCGGKHLTQLIATTVPQFFLQPSLYDMGRQCCY
jgi:hypothetical protein